MSLAMDRRFATSLVTGALLAMMAFEWKSFLPGEHAVDAVNAPAPGNAVFRPLSASEINELLSWNLFGKPAAAVLVDESAEKITDLNLSLNGVMLASDGKPYAVIGGAGENTFFSEGDRLGRLDVILVRIESDRVLLENQGVLETLRLHAEFGPAMDATPLLATEGVRAAKAVNGNKALLPMIKAESLGLHRMQMPARSSAAGLAHSPQLPSHGRPIRLSMERKKTGEIVGYRLNERDEGALASLGLRVDDVLIGVDGAPISNLNQALSAQRALYSGKQSVLMIDRQGNRMDVKINDNQKNRE